MQERVHLVTGATGFLGSVLALELLGQPDERVVCLARPGDDPAEAERRVRASLERAAGATLQRGLLRGAWTRLRVVPGDICQDLCGVAPERAGRVSHVWHSAATLRFEPELEGEIHAHNVGGTQQVLELARQLGAERFCYVSTAYVAGARSGRALEALCPVDAPVHNAYERSKILAERTVAESGLDYLIFRPSIVIGPSKTAVPAGSDSGFYGYIRRLISLKRLARRQDRLADLDRLFLPGDPEAALDLIPVDAVVHNAVAIDRLGSDDRIFHLTNAAPPRVAEAARVIGRRLGISGPHFHAGPAQGPYAEQIESHMQFFLSYLAGGKVFDRRHTDAVVGAEASLWPLYAEGLDRYVDGYVRTVERRV